jgi:hypothetical protein
MSLRKLLILRRRAQRGLEGRKALIQRSSFLSNELQPRRSGSILGMDTGLRRYDEVKFQCTLLHLTSNFSSRPTGVTRARSVHVRGRI